MDDNDALLHHAADLAAAHLRRLEERPVHPMVDGAALRAAVAVPLQEEPLDPVRVIDDLATAAGPGLVAVPGGRYFGFVTGGAVPAALAADWLTAAWDQNAFSFVSSPAAAVVEQVAGEWIKDVLALPEDASFAFVTGCQMAHVACLAAARHAVLERHGWDIGARGLTSAPPIRVVTGAKRHVTVDRALRLLGIGTDALRLTAVDGSGRIVPDDLERVLADGNGPTIVVAQAGEVNTGAFDPLPTVAGLTPDDAWLHVDGAFGIWARAAPARSHLAEGLELADSWAFDAHKWLNVPYDSGVAVVAHPEPHRAAMLGPAAYLTPTSSERDAYDYTPDASRRARGIAVYAAMRSLGRAGIADLVERCCRHATTFADRLAELPGAKILNDVELNQVLLAFEDDDRTATILRRVQASGEAWMGSTTWHGRTAIRISVSSWATAEAGVARTVAAFRTALAG